MRGDKILSQRMSSAAGNSGHVGNGLVVGDLGVRRIQRAVSDAY